MVPTSHLDRLLAHDRAGIACTLSDYLVKHPGIKRFFAPLISLAAWLLNLFNPPPLESMNVAQRTGRVFVLALTVVIGSILFAMVGTLGLYVMERGRELRDTPQFYHGLVIVLVGIAVNVGCVFVLLQIKKADTKLMPPEEK